MAVVVIVIDWLPAAAAVAEPMFVAPTSVCVVLRYNVKVVTSEVV